jgi:uncharacterized membrane protein
MFQAPPFGMPSGPPRAAPAGSPVDFGINDRLMKDLGEELGPGSAGVVLLVHEVTADKVLPEIERYGGEVIQNSPDAESETRLREALEAPAQAGAAA